MPWVPPDHLIDQIEKLLVDAPASYIERRNRQLAWGPDVVRSSVYWRLWDPAAIEEDIERQREWDDPYSELNIRRDEFLRLCDLGGEITMSRIDTGEVVDRWTARTTRRGAAEGN